MHANVVWCGVVVMCVFSTVSSLLLYCKNPRTLLPEREREREQSVNSSFLYCIYVRILSYVAFDAANVWPAPLAFLFSAAAYKRI